jgi:hypothetical protein
VILNHYTQDISGKSRKISAGFSRIDRLEPTESTSRFLHFRTAEDTNKMHKRKK